MAGAKGTYIIKDGRNPRDVALFALMNINNSGRKSNVFLRETLDRNQELSVRDKALCEHIVSATLDHLFSIDAILSEYSKTPTAKMNPYIREILRLSVCQLLFMDRVPAPSVINEGTELAKIHGISGLSGFVNGVLRNISRDNEKIRSGNASEAAEETKLTRVMKEGYIRYSVPKWLYHKFLMDFGLKAAESIFSSWLLLRKTSVRMNLSKGLSEAEIRRMIEEEGIGCEMISESPPVCELSGLSGTGVGSLRAFREGYITVQDLSASMLTTYCPPSRGDTVLDLCAAPGGKSLSYADAMEGTGTVHARDISEQKVSLIRENALRCGFGNIITEVADASVLDRKFLGKADIVVADLPCSGLGVVAKKPDIKKNVRPETILELVSLQRSILENAVQYVKPGGRLCYSTCTVTREENEENASYIADNFGLRPLLMKRIWPDEHRDGFFIAVFEKKA